MKCTSWRALCSLLVLVLLSAPAARGQNVITTVAGSTWVFRGDGGPATNAPLGGPYGVAVDAEGNIYASDEGNNRVVKVSPAGILTVVAGNGVEGFSGDGGPATSASLYRPTGVAVDAAGNLYVADQYNYRVRMVSPSGIISTVAGSGPADPYSGGFSGDGGPATRAWLYVPTGVAVDAAGSLYIADFARDRVRKVSRSGTISTVAGNGSRGFSGDGGPATSASLNGPSGVAVDPVGNLYIADEANQRVRKVNPAGIISTVAGGGYAYPGDGGPATRASLNYPQGLAVDGAGNLYVSTASLVQKVTPSGIITTVAGNGLWGYSGEDVRATAASLFCPSGVAVDAAGNLYIADWGNHRIRKVSPSGTISTVAGNGEYKFGGDGGPATAASLNYTGSVAVDATGALYIGDSDNYRVRRVAPSGIITTIAGGRFGYSSGDGGPATAAALGDTLAVAVDAAGNLYIADRFNGCVFKVTPAGIINTAAGRAGSGGYSGEGGPATAAYISAPMGVAAAPDGSLYIAAPFVSRVLRVSPAGIITTVAGNGQSAYSGDGGPATSASLGSPSGVAVDAAGNLYIAVGDRIRKVDASGIISTVAGGGYAYPGDGGPATSASLAAGGVAVDAAGNLYIADTLHYGIRKVSASGIITTVAGNGRYGFSGDGGPATGASLRGPQGVAVDAAGNVYIGDSGNDRVRKVAPAPSFTAAPASLSFNASAASQVTLSSVAAGLAWPGRPRRAPAAAATG